jgi:uncharacterized membrane protein
MADKGMLTVFAAGYDEIGDAMKDFSDMKSLHTEGQLGGYDAALVKKEPSGQVVISNVDSTGRFHAGATGAVIGGVLGAIFPPTIVGMAAVGTAAGAAGSNMRDHLKRSDFKELGALLQDGCSGILLVTDEVTERGIDELLGRSTRKVHTRTEVDAEAIKKAVGEAVMFYRVPRL